jgi:hypothetical protein
VTSTSPAGNGSLGIDDGAEQPSGPDNDRRRQLSRPWYARGFGLLGRLVVGLAVTASFAVWVYAYSGRADRDPPDLLDDPAFSQAAEPVCAAAALDLKAMPGALDARDPADRSGQIVAATGRLEAMVTVLDGLAQGSDRDLDILTAWLADWRVLIGDRYRYAEALLNDPQARFLITDTGVGERLERRITRLADTNSMSSCGAPGDVG